MGTPNPFGVAAFLLVFGGLIGQSAWLRAQLGAGWPRALALGLGLGFLAAVVGVAAVAFADTQVTKISGGSYSAVHFTLEGIILAAVATALHALLLGSIARVPFAQAARLVVPGTGVAAVSLVVLVWTAIGGH